MQKSFKNVPPGVNALNEPLILPHSTFSVLPKNNLHSELLPSHRTLLKGELGREMHAGGETKRIGV